MKLEAMLRSVLRIAFDPLIDHLDDGGVQDREQLRVVVLAVRFQIRRAAAMSAASERPSLVVRQDTEVAWLFRIWCSLR